MTCYSIPAMSHENEFSDLVWVGRYVDRLVESSGDNDYAIVYEWGDDGPGNWPPVAVLARLGGRWSRRPVLVSGRRGHVQCNHHRFMACDLGEPEHVNGH